eukprot:4850882-Alexandrium_andersonii.AAC.1
MGKLWHSLSRASDPCPGTSLPIRCYKPGVLATCSPMTACSASHPPTRAHSQNSPHLSQLSKSLRSR